MDATVITKRRSEVEEEISQLQKRLSELTHELQELNIAERVLSRLSGTENREPNLEGNQSTEASQARSDLPSVRQMIKTALFSARQRGVNGMTPQDVRQSISDVYGVTIGAQINTNLSRMLNEFKELARDDSTGRYSLLDVKSSSSKEPETDPLDDI